MTLRNSRRPEEQGSCPKCGNFEFLGSPWTATKNTLLDSGFFHGKLDAPTIRTHGPHYKTTARAQKGACQQHDSCLWIVDELTFPTYVLTRTCNSPTAKKKNTIRIEIQNQGIGLQHGQRRKLVLRLEFAKNRPRLQKNAATKDHRRPTKAPQA